MQYSRETQCDGKVKWATRQLAREARRRLEQDYPDARSVAVYRCPWCQQFHIGNRRPDPYVADLVERTENYAERRARQREAIAAIAAALNISWHEAASLHGETNSSSEA